MSYGFIRSNNRNTFYNISEDEIKQSEEKLGTMLPYELRKFLLEVGYGFIKGSDFNINRILDSNSIIDTNLKEGDFEYFPDIEIYDDFLEDKLIFFEANESVLIMIEVNKHNKNPIYYFDSKIANSLEEFLEKLLVDDEYYVDMYDV